MSQQNNKIKKTGKNSEIKIKQSKESSLAEFVRRPLPTDKELTNFEDFVDDEVREEEIEDSLSEIYQDNNGDKTDVTKLEIKKRHSFFFKLLMVIFIFSFLLFAAWASYNYLYLPASTNSSVELVIDAPAEVMAGEEFFYTINYKNLDRVDIKNAEIKLIYPENFIFLDSDPVAEKRNDTWGFDSIKTHRSGNIKIKGKIIDRLDENCIILADMTYMPTNFSSEFKKSASFEHKLSDTGIDLSFINGTSALVNEENEVVIKYKAKKNNYLNNFRLTVEQSENMEFLPTDSDDENVVATKQNIWQINEIIEEEKEIKIKFKFIEKINDQQEVIFKFEHSPDGEEYYLFDEKIINFEVIKSDLSLNLIINGSQADQGVDFGQTLYYSIVYTNKGEMEMKDVVIMAVVESDFLDWATLNDENSGIEKGNTISWSKEEISNLELLAKNDEGTIDFSIELMPLSAVESLIPAKKDFQVKSYVQFTIGELATTSSSAGEAVAASEDKRSNTIISKINSDLQLSEQVRYFSEDNIPVGTGPVPPKVGETSSFKVYWDLTNNLHELNDLQVYLDLPDYVEWNNKNRASVGTVQYNSNNHQVVWHIGRLPITVYNADAEFNISITPNENDRNKILVLLPGSTVQATDKETGVSLERTTKAKTTKLEDDEIAECDGMVE